MKTLNQSILSPHLEAVRNLSYEPLSLEFLHHIYVVLCAIGVYFVTN